jgi:hypothetical protein
MWNIPIIIPPPPTNLPVLLQLTQSYKLWQEYFDLLPKSKRHTIAGKIDELFIEVIESVSLAALAHKNEKMVHINKASTKLDLLKIFLEIAWEIGVLEKKRYIAISQTLVEPGKMIGGWMRQTQRTL